MAPELNFPLTQEAAAEGGQGGGAAMPFLASTVTISPPGKKPVHRQAQTLLSDRGPSRLSSRLWPSPTLGRSPEASRAAPAQQRRPLLSRRVLGSGGLLVVQQVEGSLWVPPLPGSPPGADAQSPTGRGAQACGPHTVSGDSTCGRT